MITIPIRLSSIGHHVFPWHLRNAFLRKGINVNDPKFGVWWEARSHLKNAPAYNREWGIFFRNNPSQAQILRFGRSIMRKHGIKVNF